MEINILPPCPPDNLTPKKLTTKTIPITDAAKTNKKC